MRKRLLYDSLVAHLSSNKFTVIVGARQTGKSTLMRQLRDYCVAEGMPVAAFNMENKSLRAEFDEAPENIFPYLPAAAGKIYVFIDEIQKLKDPSNFLKLLWDEHSDKLKLIVTGSSAFYIDKKFNDSLAGRKKVFCLYTCSFEEFLYLSQEDQLLAEYRRLKADTEARSLLLPRMKEAFFRYMQYGGYPEVVTATDEGEKQDILQDLRDSFVKKDVEDAGVKDEEAFFKLMRLLAAQTGNLVNKAELSKIVHIKEETVSDYLSIMEKSFYIRLVRPFFRNVSKELVKMPMVYFYDSGMRNCLMNNFMPCVTNPDVGAIWENQVFRLLLDHYGADAVRFWRTSDGKEVDFVLPDVLPPLAVEVKKSEAQARPGRYKSFVQAYPEFLFEFYSLLPFSESLLRKL